MTDLVLRAFGSPQIAVNGTPVRLGIRKGLALLVYLADAGRLVPRETLATLLWPEAAPEQARARLRRLLHRIGEAAHLELFDADRESVGLSQTVHLDFDVRRFEDACDHGAFDDARQAYSDDFLSGFTVSDSSEFEEWAFYRREALRGRLMQALERLVQQKNAVKEFQAAARHALHLGTLDPLSEHYARAAIRNLLLAGDRGGAERHYAQLQHRLRKDLGVAPEAETTALLREPAAPLGEATPRYTLGNGAHVAYQTYGAGALDIMVIPGFVSHIERTWDLPACRSFLQALTSMGRLILFDRRGVGLSDRVGAAPNVEITAEDIRVVLDAAGSRKIVLFGASECGPACVAFAVKNPGRVAGLVLFGSLAKGSWAPDYPLALKAEQYETWRDELVAQWGSAAGIETFGPSLAHDPGARAWWAGLLRAASSPGAIWSVLKAFRDTDVRHLLPRIACPSLILHRRGDRAVRFAAGEDMAKRIPGAKFIALDGADHWFFSGPQQPALAAIRSFLKGT